MRVADYARAVKRVESEFETDWATIEQLIEIGAAPDAIADVIATYLQVRRRAVWGIAALLLQSCAAKRGVTSPIPKYGDIKRTIVIQWVRECMAGGDVTPANLRSLRQKCVSNIRDCGRGTVAAAASMRFAPYPDKRQTEPSRDGAVPVAPKGAETDHEATEDEIDAIFSRYWDAADLARPYVPEADMPTIDASRPVRKPRGWARVIQGAETCGFCVTMAARSYDYLLYESEHTALRKDRGGYHRNCDCIAVPVFDVRSWDGKAQAKRAREWYTDHADGSWRNARANI